MNDQTTTPAPATSRAATKEIVPLALSDVQAAALLGISRGHLWTLNSSGRLPAPVKLGRSVRWIRSELESWLAAGCPTRDCWRAMKEK
ncbi:MAG: helix-turn-helix domain-containing protein [Phycisphaerae bacterium]|nr:helix-turn-helix domain-containing protein [Phycisphaerae bacterium]